jgi:hypothetical protein
MVFCFGTPKMATQSLVKGWRVAANHAGRWLRTVKQSHISNSLHLADTAYKIQFDPIVVGNGVSLDGTYPTRIVFAESWHLPFRFFGANYINPWKFG